MKITRITVFQVDLPLEHPCWLSGGRLKFDCLDATLIRIDTDSGLTGRGEGTPWGHTYVPAQGPGIRAWIDTMAGFLLGLDPRRLLRVERAKVLTLSGHLYAKAPIDMVCWDIAGQAAGLSIADLMGGGSRAPVPIASSVGARTVEETRVVIGRYRDRGYVAHSVKIGGDVDRDIARGGLAEVFGIKLNRVGGLTRAARMRDVALAHGLAMFVMATGGTVLADTEALHLAATIPDAHRRAFSACQDMITVDIAGGRGPRKNGGHLTLPDAPGLGVHPDEAALDAPVSVYG